LTALTTSEVTITQSNGQAQNISVANLRDVRFDKEPTGLLSARSAERSGALDNALKGYQDAAGAYTGDDKRLTTDLEFLIARVQAKQALTDPGKLDAAIAGLKSFREANKTNFRYLEATLVQAELHAAKQDVDAGKALLTEVQASPVRGFQLQAGVQLGRLLLASNSLPEALTAFDLVIQQSAGDDSAQAAMYDGKLGRALCLRQQGNTDDAIATLDEVIASAAESESRILAEAWVRKGDCLKQKNETKAALMAYLHVDVLYPGEPAQHAESLLRLSQLWAAVGYPDRAQDAAARLTERYPNSQWTSQIGQEG
jgi:tetratricopeptide (TPR) repeat protein